MIQASNIDLRSVDFPPALGPVRSAAEAEADPTSLCIEMLFGTDRISGIPGCLRFWATKTGEMLEMNSTSHAWRDCLVKHTAHNASRAYASLSRVRQVQMSKPLNAVRCFPKLQHVGAGSSEEDGDRYVDRSEVSGKNVCETDVPSDEHMCKRFTALHLNACMFADLRQIEVQTADSVLAISIELKTPWK